MTGSLNERLRSLQVLDAYSGMPAETAVVPLGAQGALMVEFDVLSDDRDYLRYSLTHCDASWRPSQLAEAEYIDGFNEGEIGDYAYSEAGYVVLTVSKRRYSLPASNMSCG